MKILYKNPGTSENPFFRFIITNANGDTKAAPLAITTYALLLTTLDVILHL